LFLKITYFYTYIDLTNVSHLYSDDTTDAVSNVPTTLAEATKETDYPTFWTILRYIKGVTLKEFVTQRYKHPRGFSLFDAFTLTDKLFCIIKAVHAKGVVHRDLKPDNVMIDFTNYNDPVENVEVYVVDFGMAYIETQADTDIDWSKYDQARHGTELEDSLGNRWYRVPQLSRQDISQLTVKQKNDLFHVVRRSPTIDASSICAILFWMLIQTVPEENRDKNNMAPHRREVSNIIKKIDDTTSSLTGKCE
jgi:serine/threonine protein kinase